MLNWKDLLSQDGEIRVNINCINTAIRFGFLSNRMLICEGLHALVGTNDHNMGGRRELVSQKP